MSGRATRPPSYLARLLAELDEIGAGYAKVLSASAIRRTDLNRRGSDVVFVGYPSRCWAEGDAGLEAARMVLLRARPRLGAALPAAVPPPGAHRQQAPR